MVEDGVTGRLFPAGDVSALTHHISDLMDHPDLTMKYGQAGLDRVKREYNPELHYERIMQAYKSVL